MTKPPSWQYDELKQVGKDYCDPAEAQEYDARHSQFRDVERESEMLLDALDLPADATLVDLGAGTGTFAIRAARRCATVYAVDVSEAMLDQARRKARDADVGNIVFCHGGFLTYEHNGMPVDAVVTCAALHHLPDFWKAIGLQRMNGLMKDGGVLHISDVVFSETDPLINITQWIDELSAIGGPPLREDVEMHVREEFSTFDWIMDGLLSRSGFRIKDKQLHKGVFARYLCVKETGLAQQSVPGDA